MQNRQIITSRKPDHEIVQYIQALFFHPLPICIVFFTGIYAVFMGATIYADTPISLFEKIVLNLVWAMIYYLYLYAILPRAIILMIDHRVPLFVGIWALLLVPCLVEAIVGSAWIDITEPKLAFILRYTFKNILFVMPGIAIVLGLLRQKYEAALFFTAPKSYVWLRWKNQRALPGSRSAWNALIHLEAQNQYCTIYRQNQQPEIERMSLTEVIDAYCPDTEGMRVHRSHWIAFDQIAEIKFINGNPRAILKTGDVVPVSRNAYSQLKAQFEASVLAKQISDPMRQRRKAIQ